MATVGRLRRLCVTLLSVLTLAFCAMQVWGGSNAPAAVPGESTAAPGAASAEAAPADASSATNVASPTAGPGAASPWPSPVT
jgi:hypothetical protein